jgi:DNA-binding NarL/FixJ family response regulator
MISIAIVEDHPVFRQGLAQLVETNSEFALVGAFRTIEDFLAGSVLPHMVLLDLHLPGIEGPDGVRSVVGHGCQTLIVSAATSRDAVVDAIAAGARGYLAKDAHPEEIATAISVVVSGGTYVSATLASYLLDVHRAGDGPEGLGLSAREREVLTLLARGERDEDIAEKLFISIRTVRSHLDRIRDKTGRRRRPDLTRLAMEHGLLRGTDRESPTA